MGQCNDYSNLSIAPEYSLMVPGKVMYFCFNIMVDLFEIREDHVVGFNHSPEHDNRVFKVVLTVIHLIIRTCGKFMDLFSADIDQDVICQVVIFPAAIIDLEGEDLFAFHHLEMIDDSFW